MKAPALDFAIIGMARSGSTWLANLCTGSGSLCLHDPFSFGMPDQWPRDERRWGISCTGAMLIRGFVESLDCPLLVVDRNREDCVRSLKHLTPVDDMDVDRAYRCLAEADGFHIAFDDLWDAEKMRCAWEFILPEVPFDALRHELLVDMQIQPHMEQWGRRLPVLMTTMHLVTEG